MPHMEDNNIDWSTDSEVAWIWQGGYDYEFEAPAAGMTMVGETVTKEDVDGDVYSVNMPVGFKVHDFEEFWDANVDGDQGMLDKVMRYVGEDPERVLFLAMRDRDSADAIVAMWVHHMLDQDEQSFRWMTNDLEIL